MRITPEQQQTIVDVARSILGGDATVRLFGSRVDDSKKGGDIDLYIETPRALDNRAVAICKIGAELEKRMGPRKIDVVLKDAVTPPANIHDLATRTGIIL